MNDIRKNCRFFRGSKPCVWNKKDYVECLNCNYYSSYKEKILIIKLDAIGDVLRTTCVLPKIKEIFPNSYITWITKSESRDLLLSNPSVDEVWNYEDIETIGKLHVQKWDSVYNLDNSHASCSLASLAKAREKIGFTLSETGVITPTNESALKWLRMASFDRIKRENQQSYQEIMYEICGFSSPICRPSLIIPDFLVQKAKMHIEKRFHRKQLRSHLIGINTGSGTRWPLKMLDVSRISELIHILLSKNSDYQILLLGGPNEIEKNEKIISLNDTKRVANVGCNHSLMEFSAIINECDVIVCGDTLALHIATALNVPSVICFGPTSFHEIYDYEGLVKKVFSYDLTCLSCYNGGCQKKVTCMDMISLDEIKESVEMQLMNEKTVI